MVYTFNVTDAKTEKVKTQDFEWKHILPNKNRSGKDYEFVSSSKLNKNSTRIETNSFVLSAVYAYSNHYNLIIRPDDVWIAICTQLSNYVNGRSEELRSKFVNFEGKKELVVYGAGTIKTTDYKYLCNKMTKEISRNIKDDEMRDWIIPNFTTTNETDKMVGAVVMMSVMKSYFEYKFALLCNLPGVTLLGEVEDWQNIRNRANKLLEFDLESKLMTKWTELLFPILDQLVQTSQGNPDKEWWNRIANTQGGGSGPTYLSGWITTFCVFNDKGEYQGNKMSVNPMMKTIKSDWPFIDTNDIPRGYVNVPITIDDNGTLYKTELFAGHMCASIETEESIKPSLDWALFIVSDKDSSKD